MTSAAYSTAIVAGAVELTCEGAAWALAHFDTSIVARVAVTGTSWPEPHRAAAINAVNDAARKAAA